MLRRAVFRTFLQHRCVRGDPCHRPVPSLHSTVHDAARRSVLALFPACQLFPFDPDSLHMAHVIPNISSNDRFLPRPTASFAWVQHPCSVLQYVSEARGTCLHVSRYHQKIRSYPFSSPHPCFLGQNLPGNLRRVGRTNRRDGRRTIPLVDPTAGYRGHNDPNGCRCQLRKRWRQGRIPRRTTSDACVRIPCCSSTELEQWDDIRILPRAPRMSFDGHDAGFANVSNPFFDWACHVTLSCKRCVMHRDRTAAVSTSLEVGG